MQLRSHCRKPQPLGLIFHDLGPQGQLARLFLQHRWQLSGNGLFVPCTRMVWGKALRRVTSASAVWELATVLPGWQEEPALAAPGHRMFTQ